MTDQTLVPPRTRFEEIWPGLFAAVSFALTDVMGKAALLDGADPFTVLSIRGLVGLALIAAWLKISPPTRTLSSRELWIALALGLLFAANVYALLMSMYLTSVPLGVLTYFIYPLLTGLVAVATRTDTVSWRGGVAAVVALAGMALMIGANPAGILWFGVALSLTAAVCRTVMLIVTRKTLQGADLKRVTWNYMLASTAGFLVFNLASWTWIAPHTTGAWVATLAYAATMVAGIASLFASTGRIGPFRTAMLMNLEPPLATIVSAIVLNETITVVQMLGAAVMLGAITIFQLRR